MYGSENQKTHKYAHDYNVLCNKDKYLWSYKNSVLAKMLEIAVKMCCWGAWRVCWLFKVSRLQTSFWTFMLKCSGFKNTKIRSIKSCVCAAEMVSTGGINPALVILLAIVALVEILLDNLGQTKFWIKTSFFHGSHHCLQRQSCLSSSHFLS